MFEKALDKVDSWIGSSFIISSLLPAVIFVFCNFFLLRELLPKIDNSIKSVLSNTLTGYIDLVSFLIFSCVALAYITDPVVQYMIKVIDGSYFPRLIRRDLIYEKTKEYDLMLESKSDIINRVGELAKIEKQFYFKKDDLPYGHAQDAYLVGLPLAEIRHRGLVNVAHRKVAHLWTERQRGGLLFPGKLFDAMESLVLALENNCPDWKRVASDRRNRRARWLSARGYLKSEWDKAASKRLQQTWERARTLITYGVLSARAEQSRIEDEINRRWPKMSDDARSEHFTPIKPTKFGNIFVTASSFTERTFELNLDFLLPVLQVVVAEDKALADSFAKAQQQLNFTIRIFFYVSFSIILWLGLATALGSSATFVIAIGAAGLIVAALALEAVLASTKGFVESIKTVSILKRFEVLKALHMPLPKDAEEERANWKNISDQLQWGGKLNIPYDHSTKT